LTVVNASTAAAADEITLSDYSFTTNLQTILPVGGGPNSIITIIGYVQDAFGCAAQAYTAVTVTPPQGSITEQQDFLKNQTSSLESMADGKNPSQVLNMVNILASMLDAPSTDDEDMPDDSGLSSSGSSADTPLRTPSTTAAPEPPSSSNPAVTSLTPTPTVKRIKTCPTKVAATICSGQGRCRLSIPGCAYDHLDCTADCECNANWYDRFV
jgi:hypothetical protein